MPISAKELGDEQHDPDVIGDLSLKVTGSFIFEDVESGEFTVNIFRSKDFQGNEYHP